MISKEKFTCCYNAINLEIKSKNKVGKSICWKVRKSF